MNALKPHLLATVAAIGFIGFAGTASADACDDIEKFGLANRPAIEQSLLAHFQERAEVVMGRGNDPLRVQGISGCRARVKMNAGLRDVTGSNPELGTITKTRTGSMEMFVIFNPKEGNKLCINKTDLQKVQWADMGPVKEKLFVRRNDDKNFFTGCLF